MYAIRSYYAFSGFDPINANMLKEEILELKKNGATIIFSTHNMSSVEEICDYIALINKSKKILDGSIDTVRKTYASDIYEINYGGYFNKLGTTLTSDYKIIEMNETNGGGRIKVEVLNREMGGNRITSYNVCYTKLLRSAGSVLASNNIHPLYFIPTNKFINC